MIKVKATIKDNDDASFSTEATAIISGPDYLTHQDCMNVCTSDEYDAAEERIEKAFSKSNYLPSGWYYASDFEIIEYIY